MLRGCERALVEAYDAALVDLDGVLYLGDVAIPGAAAAVASARERGMRMVFVTNNASRTPQTVAERLAGLGVAATAADIVTSAQAVGSLLVERFPAGSPVLVVGGEGLLAEVRAAGMRPVFRAEEGPVAVAQGFAPEVSWRELAEAAVAVRAGAVWVAANTDLTLPSPRGALPGNGALVSAVQAASGGAPIVAGKPFAPLHAEATRRAGARRPLVVGDRLDTDIEGAVRAGVDSLLVLTGVSDLPAVARAAPDRRPSYLGWDLCALLAPAPPVQVCPPSARCARAEVVAAHGKVRWRAGDLDSARAAVALCWTLSDAGQVTSLEDDVPSEEQ